MANMQARRNKSGKIISYSIRVHKGYGMTTGRQLKPYVTTYKVPNGMSSGKAEKEAEKLAVLFEKQVKDGLVSDSKQTFEKYAEYVINLKQRNGIKHKTILRYKSLLARINPELGHLKLTEIKPVHLNNLYEKLFRDGENKHSKGKLSNKTIVEHHRLISTILQQANKEMLIPFNIASKATPPKIVKKEVNYKQIEEIIEIKKCLEYEPIKWKTLTNVLIFSGSRRGEVLGLKWPRIYFDSNEIEISNNLQYAPDIGIYEETPKTESSGRRIEMPQEVMDLLKKYKKWYEEQKSLYGTKWIDSGFVFVNANGGPMHPDSLNSFLERFAKRHNLKPVNPHSFRHTMASILFFEGIDSITISKRLGHAKVSTTTDIYGHILKHADKKASNALANALQLNKYGDNR